MPNVSLPSLTLTAIPSQSLRKLVRGSGNLHKFVVCDSCHRAARALQTDLVVVSYRPHKLGVLSDCILGDVLLHLNLFPFSFVKFRLLLLIFFISTWAMLQIPFILQLARSSHLDSSIRMPTTSSMSPSVFTLSWTQYHRMGARYGADSVCLLPS